MADDRASRRAASDFLEARARECSSRSGKGVRSALRYARIDWISFERRCPRALRCLQSRGDELRHDPLPAIAPADEETRDGPDGHIVHAPEPPHVIKPRQRIAWCKLAPAYREIS